MMRGTVIFGYESQTVFSQYKMYMKSAGFSLKIAGAALYIKQTYTRVHT